MSRPDEVVFELECGARVTLRVRVAVRECRAGDGRCPTAVEIAGLIWLALQDEEAERPSPQ